MITLRPFQETAAEGIRAAYRGGFTAPMLVSPTGSGKTVLFSYIAQEAGRRGNDVLILVHRKELIRQTSRTLDEFGVAHGCISPKYPATDSRVQVASVQTLARRLDAARRAPSLIIADECHHATSGSTWGRIIEHYAGVPLLGVTATPERLDGRGLGVDAGGFFDHMVLGPSVAELVTDGYLSEPVVYAPPGGPDLSGVHTRAGDFARDEIEDRMLRPVITGNAVEHYGRFCEGGPAIAFCVSVKHAETMAEAFRAGGYQAASIDGKLGDAERDARLADLSAGRLNVLTSCDIISEGFDAPVVSAAILLRPTQSLGLALQQMGRALRPHPGKTHSVILDHAGNCHRHGLPDDDRVWTLDAKPRRKREPSGDDVKIRQCPKCYYVHTPGPVCPKCGHVYVVEPRRIEYRKGELERMVRRRARAQERSAETYGDLVALGKRRGYTNPYGWANKRVIARAKTLPELIAVGESLGRKDPVKWAEFQWEKRGEQ